VSFHTFRQTCASLLFAEGKNVKQVQEWLGHADPGFTLRTYVHLLDDGLGDADFLDEAVTADPSRVNAGSTEGPQAAANAGTEGSADMALSSQISQQPRAPGSARDISKVVGSIPTRPIAGAGR
jgi:hypothetical protein